MTEEKPSPASARTTAAVAGVFFLLTHVTSVIARVLYDPVFQDSRYVAGAGADTRILWGAFLEGLLVLSIVGTGVALYPYVRRQQESVALGYVALRTLEAAIISVGIVLMPALVTLRQDAAGTGGGEALVPAGRALMAVQEWTFHLGPSFVLGVSTFLLAYLMYRSGLVARWIGVLGMIGGPLVFLQAVAVLFGLIEQISAAGAVTALPVFAWEVSLALHLVVKGFRSQARTRLVS
jgi:hypothetical protein